MQNAVLKIDGMDGEACADKITELLSRIAGVSDVRVSLLDGQASVSLDETQVTPHALKRSLELAGYPTCANSAAREQAAATGGCCGGCGGGGH